MMKEVHEKKLVLSLRSTESKVGVCIAGWYVISLLTLWTNRYVLTTLHVNSNVLSLAQLSMSVLGGLSLELYLDGWTVCKRSLRKVVSDGLKEMVLLAGVRILTVLLGLTALKYIAVSFTQTIKSSAPFFTVMLAYFLLGQRTGWRVNFSLIPIGTGLVFCSLSDSSFHVLGFTAALMSNCTDCIQNVLTKRLLMRSYTASQLQFYTSIIAVAMQVLFIAYSWMSVPIEPALGASKTDRSAAFVFCVLVLDGMCFYIQSALAYMLMSLVSPITHSVANCVKRALIIVLSIYRYGENVSVLNWCGMALVVFGVYGFNAASRIESKHPVKGPEIAPAIPVSVSTCTINALSEIRVEKGK